MMVACRPPFSQKRSDDVGGDPNIRYYHSYWQVRSYGDPPDAQGHFECSCTPIDTADAGAGDPRGGAGMRPLELPAQQLLA